MNNVAYVRAFLDCFTADEVASMPVKTMEARYITACMEGEELKIFKKRTDTGFVLRRSPRRRQVRRVFGNNP